jgi:transketolase
MRKILSDLLAQAALKDPRIIVMSGDHGYALFDDIREKCPTQFMNCGVAEQNMVGVAAGLAKAGFRPIVYGLAAFVPIRVLEQIKIDVCLEELPVIFLGDGAGFVYSSLGSSHQCFEDIAALRALPNIEIFSPADRFELSRCFDAALEIARPSYLRLGKADLGDVHQEGIKGDHTDFVFPVIADGHENLCLATGSMVSITKHVIERASLAYDVYSVARLKKIEPDRLLRLCQGRKRIIVAEEHSIYGGLGSIVAEAIAGKISVKFDRIGIQDKFSGECGSYDYLLRYHGLDEPSLLKVLRNDT